MEHDAPSPRDRLGALLDCLPHHIVSHLRARQLVHTSLLSQRWRHVWRNAPRLDVDRREFQCSAATAPSTADHERERRERREQAERFEKFTDSLVLHRGDHGPNLSLDAFRFFVADDLCHRSSQSHGASGTLRGSPRTRRICRSGYAAYRGGAAFLQRYRPAALDICFGSRIFLRRNSLGADLRFLRTLRLELLALDTGFEHHLSASGCPLLEHLELKHCCVVAFEEVVTSRALKTMVVDRCSTGESASYDGIRPRIRTPGLASLRLDLLDCYGAWMHEMPSLVQATVRYETTGIAVPWLPYGFDYDLLCSLYNVTRLELSGLPPLETVMVMGLHGDLHQSGPSFQATVDEDLPKFPNLTTLLLNECDLTGQVHTTMLELFLQNAPCLEKLILHYCKNILNAGNLKLPPRSKSKRTSYQCMNLKLAEIKYCDEVGVCQVAELLLGVTKDLQKISIRLCKD
ncbi:hypothetical protein ACQ4PT_059026 [Festuca glaucescens]